ncbi:MAG: TetR/AcrR family transcriptional regulator [Myxococcales bacterium]|nr:TetR/AcrR family transcriptional regulator [Myxococcales bacterium]
MDVILQLHLSEQLYVRNPERTELGRRIVDAAIRLMDRVGLERFTFKKLADEIGSTEASVYRYFENKHRLLVYLVSWYWAWIEYRIQFHTHNVVDPRQRLRSVVAVLAESTTYDPSFAHIDEAALHRIVVVESGKVYQATSVDADNEVGLFAGYKAVCNSIAGHISEIAPTYPYPRALASTIIEASHQQVFFAQHLPSLTEVQLSGESQYQPVADFLLDLLGRTLATDL